MLRDDPGGAIGELDVQLRPRNSVLPALTGFAAQHDHITWLDDTGGGGVAIGEPIQGAGYQRNCGDIFLEAFGVINVAIDIALAGIPLDYWTVA